VLRAASIPESLGIEMSSAAPTAISFDTLER
jgi:hypothetical protein